MTKQLQHALHHALVLHKAGRMAPAVACYQRILTALPLHAEANTHLGALLLQQGHAERAIPYLKNARQCQPHLVQHWLRLLHALQVIGDDTHAFELLEAATQFNLPPSELERLSRNLNAPPEQRQLALLQLYQRGNHVSTEIAAYMFIENFPAHPLGWQVLGAAQHDTGQWLLALHTRLQTVKDFANDANAHNNLAHTQLALGDCAAALASSRKALAIDPTHSAALQHEAQALAGLLVLKAA